MNSPRLPLSLSAIVLAGGQSRRMGQDKALLEVDGVPLLGRVYAAIAPLVQDIYGVTAWPERYEHLLPDRVHWIHDRQTQGPLIGFAQGLAQIETDWVLLLACDLPYLETSILAQWAEGLRGLPPETIAYLPRGEKGWEPLCGFYHRTCLTDLIDRIAQGERSFQRWLEGAIVAEIPGVDPRMVFNCNRPEDFAQLSQQPSDR